jgi:uncharacterized membrane protein
MLKFVFKSSIFIVCVAILSWLLILTMLPLSSLLFNSHLTLNSLFFGTLSLLVISMSIWFRKVENEYYEAVRKKKSEEAAKKVFAAYEKTTKGFFKIGLALSLIAVIFLLLSILEFS